MTVYNIYIPQTIVETCQYCYGLGTITYYPDYNPQTSCAINYSTCPVCEGKGLVEIKPILKPC